MFRTLLEEEKQEGEEEEEEKEEDDEEEKKEEEEEKEEGKNSAGLQATVLLRDRVKILAKDPANSSKVPKENKTKQRKYLGPKNKRPNFLAHKKA